MTRRRPSPGARREIRRLVEDYRREGLGMRESIAKASQDARRKGFRTR